MNAFSYITHLAEAAHKPYQDYWIQKMSVLEGVRYFRTIPFSERTMMMALLSQCPNPSALIVNKMTDDYWEAHDVVFDYKVFRQDDKPPDPLNHQPYPSSEISFTPPLKKLAQIKW